MTEEQLCALSKDYLVNVVLRSQQALRDSDDELRKGQVLVLTSANHGGKLQESNGTSERIKERVEKVREVCFREVKKQTKWQLSCKQSKTKRSYTGIVPNVEVLQ